MDNVRSVGTPETRVEGEGRAPASRRTGAPSFTTQLGQALDGVDRLQLAADGQAERIAAGGGNLHETALALEKADVAMRLVIKVRNKVVEAYQEIMRMSV